VRESPYPAPATVSLIGMPGAGKSTAGVLLAKELGLRFTDTDLDIQQQAGMTLQDILESRGHLPLRALEEQVLLSVNLEDAVIATGGSVVYSDAIMQRLKNAGPVVYLRVELAELERRVAAAPPRGIASDLGYGAVYEERCPLYESYADVIVDCTGTLETVTAQIRQFLNSSGWAGHVR